MFYSQFDTNLVPISWAIYTFQCSLLYYVGPLFIKNNTNSLLAVCILLLTNASSQELHIRSTLEMQASAFARALKD